MAIHIDMNNLRPALAAVEKRLRKLSGRNCKIEDVFREVGLAEAIRSAVVRPLVGQGALRIREDFSVHAEWRDDWGPLEPVLPSDGDCHD